MIETTRFGRVEVDASEVIRFQGLPGFPEARRFVVMEHSSESLFAWLVSLDDPSLALVIASPWNFFPGYDPPVETRQLQALGIQSADELEVVTIASLDSGSVRLNLAAPILINTRDRRGVQLIAESSRYSVSEKIPDLEPKAQQSRSRRSGSRGEKSGSRQGRRRRAAPVGPVPTTGPE